ncbi:hypothetical protein RUM44_007089 [Polyplax serrata]|uniref:Uncharacterized protein n=1 Tax=Polyplax serrata TaxID=468196 RepID=A0ABR1B1C3_POLSC
MKAINGRVVSDKTKKFEPDLKAEERLQKGAVTRQEKLTARNRKKEDTGREVERERQTERERERQTERQIPPEDRKRELHSVKNSISEIKTTKEETLIENDKREQVEVL